MKGEKFLTNKEFNYCRSPKIGILEFYDKYKEIYHAYALIFEAAIEKTRSGYEYLFSWDNVLGSDSEKLRMLLSYDLDIDWAKNAKIRKSDDGKTIRIFKDKNSAGIMIDEKKGKATLKISDGRTYDLKVKKEKGKLNIYVFEFPLWSKKYALWIDSCRNMGERLGEIALEFHEPLMNELTYRELDPLSKDQKEKEKAENYVNLLSILAISNGSLKQYEK